MFGIQNKRSSHKQYQQGSSDLKVPQSTAHKRSQSTGSIHSSRSGRGSSSLKKNVSTRTFHFSDSIYQGQMQAFHRTGKGIILHDNGLSGVIRSGINRFKDHNVFIGQNCIISGIFLEHQLDFVFKYYRNILVVSMNKNNESISLNPLGYLIEYQFQRVSRLKFKNDVLVQKMALTKKQMEEIINQENFINIMKQEHIEALKLNLYDQNFTQIDIIPKHRNQLHVGFTKTTQKTHDTTYKLSFGQKDCQNTYLNGLGFIIQRINCHPSRLFDYDFKILQRGFYSDGKLNFFGQQYYDNGNFYFGGLKDQKMHGKGILVFKKQNKFAYGTFQQGKPVKLDEKVQYRLDTKQGIDIYFNLRRKIHSSNPQIWIDGQINNMPDPDYFISKLTECQHFLCQNQQYVNYVKTQEDLQLSRKVEQFQSESKFERQNLKRPPSTITFGLKQARGPFHEVFQHQQTSHAGNKLIISSEIKSPSREIRPQNSSFYQNRNNISYQNGQFNDKISLNDSIIKRLGQNSSIRQKDRRIKQMDDPNQRIGSLIAAGYAPTFQDDSLEKYKIPSSRRNSSERKRNTFSDLPIQSQVKRSLDKKKSILTDFLGEENIRAQKLQKEYQELQRSPFGYQQKSDYRPIHIRKSPQVYSSPAKLSKSKYRLRQKIQPSNYIMSEFKRDTSQMDRKYIQAGYQSIKLGNSNKIKEEKYMHYDHYTHKRHFDYTTGMNNQIVKRDIGRPSRIQNETNNLQPKYVKTPQKYPKYDSQQDSFSNRTLKKHQADNLIGRLYPHAKNEVKSFGQSKYDSSQIQSRPLNTQGRSFKDQKYSNIQSQYLQKKYPYGKDFKSSIIRNNALGLSNSRLS